jgi:hypothetical protein
MCAATRRVRWSSRALSRARLRGRVPQRGRSIGSEGLGEIESGAGGGGGEGVVGWGVGVTVVVSSNGVIAGEA